jgi:sulfatase modifying factor 1
VCASSNAQSILAEANDMVLVPAGEFIMGENRTFLDAAPEHTVWLDSFYIDKHEVTNAEYKRFVDATDHPAPYLDPEKYPWAKPFNWIDGTYPKGTEVLPVVLVDWYDATAYAAWRGCRLPTEAEWEKAARGTDGKIYPWGDKWDSTRVWFRLTSFHRPKGENKSSNDISPYGVINTAGNVAEWCNDFYDYDKNYYVTSPDTNPQGAQVGSRKIVRGGSWQVVDNEKMTAFFRNAQFSSTKSIAIGFRCMRSLKN